MTGRTIETAGDYHKQLEAMFSRRNESEKVRYALKRIRDSACVNARRVLDSKIDFKKDYKAELKDLSNSIVRDRTTYIV